MGEGKEEWKMERLGMGGKRTGGRVDRAQREEAGDIFSFSVLYFCGYWLSSGVKFFLRICSRCLIACRYVIAAFIVT